MKQCKDTTNIYFYETENAYCGGNYYQKEQIVKALEAARLSAEEKNIKKGTNHAKAIIYKFTMDDMLVNLYISKRYEQMNKEYINIFDRWERKDKKSHLKKLKLIAITAAISAGVTTIAYEPVKETIKTFIEKTNDLLTDEVGDLENEILIHSGYGYTPDGKSISPYLDHGCVLSDDKNLSIQERISLYCEEHDLEYIKEIALEKYNHLINDDKEFANTIDLKEIEQEYIEKQKSKN